VKQLTCDLHLRHHFPAVLGCAGVCVWRNTVPRTDLWRTSATRVEVDQRSREARLHLEQAQRLLGLQTRSWLSRMRYRFGSRLFGGGRVAGGSADAAAAGSREDEGRDIPTGFGLLASAVSLAVLAALAGATA
jgi:hypothetical protein